MTNKTELFEKMDALDERLIREGNPQPVVGAGGATSLSFYGYRKVAVVNGVKVLDWKTKVFGPIITAIVKIHNPKTGWTGYGASSCRNTIENRAFMVAERKAFRNAVRLSFPPAYLREVTFHIERSQNDKQNKRRA